MNAIPWPHRGMLPTALLMVDKYYSQLSLKRQCTERMCKGALTRVSLTRETLPERWNSSKSYSGFFLYTLYFICVFISFQIHNISCTFQNFYKILEIIFKVLNNKSNDWWLSRSLVAEWRVHRTAMQEVSIESRIINRGISVHQNLKKNTGD